MIPRIWLRCISVGVLAGWVLFTAMPFSLSTMAQSTAQDQNKKSIADGIDQPGPEKSKDETIHAPKAEANGDSTKPDPTAAGYAKPCTTPPPGVSKPGPKPPVTPKPDAAKPCVKLVKVIVDPAGKGSFTHELAGDDNRTCFPLPFQAADFPEAARTMRITKTGSVEPLRYSFIPDPLFSSLIVPTTKSDTTDATAKAGPLPLTDLLNQLRGQEVEYSTDGGTNLIKGTILSIDAGSTGGNNQGGNTTPGASTTPGGNTGGGKSYTLNLTTATGFVAIPLPLTSTTKVLLTDKRVTNQIQEAMTELARGNQLNKRTLTIQIQDLQIAVNSKLSVNYSHPLPPWEINYDLNLTDVSKPKLTANVTVRNTTAQDWNSVDLTIRGLPWTVGNGPSEYQVQKVTIKANERATIFIPAIPKIELTNPTLTYWIGQPKEHPEQQVQLKILAPVYPVLGPLSITANGKEIGHSDTFDLGASAGPVVKYFQTQWLISRGNVVSGIPRKVCLVNGFLSYQETRNTQLFISNVAEPTAIPEYNFFLTTFVMGNDPISRALWTRIPSPYTVQILKLVAEPTWVLETPEEYTKYESIINDPIDVREVSQVRRVNVVTMSPADIKKFIATLPKSNTPNENYEAIATGLTAVTVKQAEVASKLAEFKLQRQALVTAINSIAQRQPPTPDGNHISRPEQRLQDEAAVAKLRGEIENLTAVSAQLQQDLEHFICSFQLDFSGPPVFPAGMIQPTVP